MKNICKKTIVISIILLLVGVSISSAISVDTKSTISNNQSKEDSYYPGIEFFSICLITGYYETKTSNSEYMLILENIEGNNTIKVIGITFYYYYGKAPMFGFDNVQVWKIKAVYFFGISFLGFVFGIGTGVRVEPNPYPL